MPENYASQSEFSNQKRWMRSQSVLDTLKDDDKQKIFVHAVLVMRKVHKLIEGEDF